MPDPGGEPAPQSQLADDLAGARDRLVAFVQSCSDSDWCACPVAGDQRPVGVIADHVGHAYEYLGGFARNVLAGQPAGVSSELIDSLNAQHAVAAAAVGREQAVAHLGRSGDDLVELVRSLHPADLDRDGGVLRRLAQIGARHADGHRTEIEAALGARTA